MEHVVVMDAVLAGARLDVHFTRYAEEGASSTCVDDVVAAQNNINQHQSTSTDSSSAARNVVPENVAAPAVSGALYSGDDSRDSATQTKKSRSP